MHGFSLSNHQHFIPLKELHVFSLSTHFHILGCSTHVKQYIAFQPISMTPDPGTSGTIYTNLSPGRKDDTRKTVSFVMNTSE